MTLSDASRRRPWLAFLLTLLQPGLGQVYAGKLKRGVVVFVVLNVLAFVIIGIVLFAPGVAVPILSALALPLGLSVAIDAVVQARRAPQPYVLHSYNRWYVYVGAVAVIVALNLLRPDVVQAFRLPSGSMAPTLLPGDWVYVDKRSSTLNSVGRTALVVFRTPDDSATVIKRVVGVAGDTLWMRGDTLIRNGSIVAEPYVDWMRFAHDTAGTKDVGTWGPVVVPQHSVLVLGDDRHMSKDSRHYGSVPTSGFVGVPTVISYSYDPEGDSPLPWFTAVRWSRLGATLR